MQIIEKSRVIMDNPYSPFRYFAWPTVGRMPDGTLAVVTSGERLRHVCPFGKTVISFSRDEGKTWSLPATLFDTVLDDRDGGLCVAGDMAIATSFTGRMQTQENYLKYVDDPAQIELTRAMLKTIPADAEEHFFGSTYRISRDSGVTWGELKFAPVSSPHGPCRMPDGRVVWVGTRYEKDCKSGGIYCCEMDGKEHFSIIGQIPPCTHASGEVVGCEPHAIALDDGRLLAAIRVQRGEPDPIFTIYLSESTDGGKTFTEPRQLLADRQGAPAHLMLHSSGALILSYASRWDDKGIRAMVSYDGGRTWGEEIKLTANEDHSDLGYTSSVERRDGSILSVYYDNPESWTHPTAKIRQIIWKL